MYHCLLQHVFEKKERACAICSSPSRYESGKRTPYSKLFVSPCNRATCWHFRKWHSALNMQHQGCWFIRRQQSFSSERLIVIGNEGRPWKTILFHFRPRWPSSYWSSAASYNKHPSLRQNPFAQLLWAHLPRNTVLKLDDSPLLVMGCW
jgi:hypothetical protein